MTTIYCITNKLNGMKYVGQTIRSPRVRFTEHCNKKIKNISLINRAIKTYGKDNFEFSILEENIPLELKNAREQFWIDNMASMSPNGYNIEYVVGTKKGRPNYGAVARSGIDDATSFKLQDLDGEVWKWIKGFTGSYKVSNFGRFKSVSRIVKGKWEAGYTVHETLLSGRRKGDRSNKSPVYLLCVAGIKTHLYSPVIVWEAFNGRIPKGSIIKFKDKNAANVELSNLEVVTHCHSLRLESAGITEHQGKYQVRITLDKKRHYVGYFNSYETALLEKKKYIQKVLGVSPEFKEN